MKQGGKALFRVVQGLLALALLGDFLQHAHHAGLAIGSRHPAAPDLQPVQGAVWPANAVVSAALLGGIFEHGIKGQLSFGPIVERQG